MAGTSMIDKATATGAGASFNMPDAKTTFQASGATSAGAGSATVVVQVSNDGGDNWITAGTITLTLATTESSDGFALDAPWDLVRGNVTAISGTGAYVSLFGTGLIGV